MAERRYKATRSEPEAAEWRALLEPGSRHVALDACWSGLRVSREYSNAEGRLGGQAPATTDDGIQLGSIVMYRIDKALENAADSREETCTSDPCGPGRFNFNFMNHLDSEPAAYDGSG
ncbi:hypothetical protein FOZ62_018278 [Perkinsus olseni]|uniref:Uncharacterized protein n=1 Tax=Perkinsus olseni TaxID=32597 RepID=A0A7J6TH80_PEROL|nr:hypothetical protein FOZ62_018278 [Perkinsus olseni]